MCAGGGADLTERRSACILSAVWQNDDGEDDPIPGPVPDPSARHWRHPSELGHQHALPNPDPTPIPVGSPPAGSPSIVWPLTVVGGCVAAAALGVLVLSLTGVDEPTLTTGSGSVATAGAGIDLADDDGRGTGREATSTTQLWAADRSSPGGAAGGQAGAAPDGVYRGGDGSPATALGGETTIPTLPRPGRSVDEKATTPASPVTLVGVFAGPDPDGIPIASFVQVGGHLITSASSVAPRQLVWLRVGDRWLETEVTASDALTDVALLTPLDPDTDLALPPLEPVDEPPGVGTAAVVGYGFQIDSDADGAPDTLVDPLRPEEPTIVGGQTDRPDRDGTPSGESEEGSIRSRALSEEGEVDEGDQPPGGNNLEADGATGNSGTANSTAKGTANGAAPSESGPGGAKGGARTDPETAEPGWEASRPEAEGADGSSDGDEPDRGKIYSLRQPLKTLAGRVVYEPIRTGISRVVGDAGGPLRNAEGQLLGLVLGTGSPQVAALPIERAIDVAEMLYRWGIGNLAWVGVETAATEDGLRVVEVNRAGPAVDLSPGDLIIAVDGTEVTHPDHFEHLVRRAGPGGALAITVDQRGRRTTIEIDVATMALP